MPVQLTKITTMRQRLNPISVFCGFICLFLFDVSSSADALDEKALEDRFLSPLVGLLSELGLDVAHNLNDREVVRQRIQRPRLGRFPDIPTGSLPSSKELQQWEEAYVSGEVGGLVVLANGSRLQDSQSADFTSSWLDAADSERIFVSFHQDDQNIANSLQRVIIESGLAAEIFFAGSDTDRVGQFYATAAQRLAIDSKTARRYRSDIDEFDYLGEKLRRNSDSLFREDGGADKRALARNEPSVFQKVTLGDQFNQSTIREIIVPGGVALGETADLSLQIVSMSYRDEALVLQDVNGESWHLPALDLRTQKALYDFAQRSEGIASDAIVDIDENRYVRISSALKDTDAGYDILHADTQPFNFVRNLRVTKSVVIDTAVVWKNSEANLLQFDTSYEVRFLSADNMRIAQTRAALEYQYDSRTELSSYLDSWGRDARRLDENLDYSGLGKSMSELANYAGWVALFRLLIEDEVSFLRGRYQFMKIDKNGQETPARY